MYKCMCCGDDLKKIESIGLEIGSFNLDKQEDKKVKFSLSIGSKKIGNTDTKEGSLEDTYYCEKCNKAFAIYNL